MMAKAAHPHLVARGGGAIVNFTSISAKVAQTGRWLYPVAQGCARPAHAQHGDGPRADGIRVNSVSPGWTWSKVMAS